MVRYGNEDIKMKRTGQASCSLRGALGIVRMEGAECGAPGL